jgi:uncharacterized membrane protein YccC
VDVVAPVPELLRRRSLLGGGEALRRALRSALPALLHGLRLSASVSLALVVACWLQLDNAYWAATSASIVAQPALGASLRKGRFRAIGTVIGGIAIVALAAAFPQDRVGFLLTLTLWAAVCGYLATILTNFAGYAAALAGYTVVIVFAGIVDHPQDVFLVTVRRISEIGIGIFSAGLVHSLTDFGNARRRLAEAMTDVARGIASGLAMTLRTGEETPQLIAARRTLIARAIALDPLIDEAIGEPTHLRHQGGRLQAAFQALFVALSSWRGIGNHLGATSEATPTRFRLITPIASLAERDWLSNPQEMRTLCQEESACVRRGEAQDLSSRLLRDGVARVLESLGVVAEALLAITGPRDEPRSPVKSRFVVPDPLPALVNALRVVLALVAAETIWIATGWPHGPLMITFTAVAVILFARQADAAYSNAVEYAVGCVIASLLAGMLDFVVLPLVHGGPWPLSLALTLAFLPFGALSAGSWHKAVFVSAVTNLMPIVSIENEQAYDGARVLNTAVAVCAGAVIAAVFFRLLPPVAPSRRIERLLAFTRRDLRSLVSTRRQFTQESWLGLLSARLAAMPKEASLEQEAQLLGVLSVGEAAIALLTDRSGGEEHPTLDHAFPCLAERKIPEARESLIRFATAQRPPSVTEGSRRTDAAVEATLIAEALQRHQGFFAKAP